MTRTSKYNTKKRKLNKILKPETEKRSKRVSNKIDRMLSLGIFGIGAVIVIIEVIDEYKRKHTNS